MPHDDYLPVPMDSSEACNLGRSMGYLYIRKFRRKHPEMPHPPIEVVNLFRDTGEKVALGILRDCAPWTAREFMARIARAIEHPPAEAARNA